MGQLLTSDPHYLAPYGIYTVADRNFFSGAVAAVNSLRHHGYKGPIAVIDVGLREWMRAHLLSYDDLFVLDIEYLKRAVRYVDVLSSEIPVMHGWAFKAFGISHFNLFESFTFIDADYLPLTNVEAVVRPLIEAGQFVSTPDGNNTWTNLHRDAVGVATGSYPNVNAGFVSLSMLHHDYVVHEWRNLMTRRKPFELWYGDQGALNAILDKHGVEKTTLSELLWNQTWLNGTLKACDAVVFEKFPEPRLIHSPTGQRFMGWHGWGWHKPWHALGIDEYREDAADRDRFRRECLDRIPEPAIAAFKYFLFLDGFGAALEQRGHAILPAGCEH